MPSTIKNAGSIFQRAIDDVLRKHIGKTCYVFVDDLIIFSESEADHLRHIKMILKCSIDANMRVSQEKTKFRDSIEYLGFIVTGGGARTDPEKVKPYKNTSNPRTCSV